jgi:hypothetical protein
MGNYLEGRILKRVGNNRADIWELLIAYVNNSEGEEGRAAFTELVSEGIRGIHGVGLDPDGNLNDIECCEDVKAGVSLADLAHRYKPEVRELLTWLANGANHDAKLIYRACAFLMHHGNAIVMHWEPILPKSDGEDDLILEWPESCRSVLSPVCRFIKAAIDRHDTDGIPLRTVIPIVLCDRPGCGKFRMVKVVNREAAHVFCSNLCKATFHQSAKTRDEKAKYMRGHRGTLDRNKPEVTKGRNSAKRIAKGKTKGRV